MPVIDVPPTPSQYEWQVSETTQKTHLILYFDMNKTLIASDKEGGKTAREAVIEAVAEQAMGTWDNSIPEPISYADYVKHHLLPNSNRSQQLAQIQKVFEVLGKEHPQYEKLLNIYNQAMQALKQQENQLVFKSFYRLVEFLKEKNVSYTLVIRTFGAEGPEVAKELNQSFGDTFIADFRVLHEGQLEGADLYQFVTSTDHHLLIQDDWKWWSNNGKDWHYGKPFPVDSKDSGFISLFFDDNAKENIVFPYDAVTREPIPPSEAIDQGKLIVVDPLEALCNENYYIQFVEKVID